MIVKYNHPGILVIGHKSGSIRLMPEVNEVPAEQWALVSENPMVKCMIEEGKLEIISADVPSAKSDAGKQDDVSLAGFHPAKAVKLVKSTVDRDLLKKWLATEKRQSVCKALNEQLDVVTVKPSAAKQVEASIG